MARSTKIAALNDAFRTTFTGGKTLITAGVNALPVETQMGVIQAVKSFDKFDADNDPYGEHDFGAVEYAGENFMWKIDYYDLGMNGGSENAADPAQTTRVLTIMLAEEY